MGHQNSAVQQGAFGLLDPAETIDQGPRSRGQRLRPHPRMSVDNEKNVGSPLGRGNLRRNTYAQPNVLVLQQSNSKRKDGNTDMPDVQYTFQEVSASQEKELRRWLLQMGSQFLHTNEMLPLYQSQKILCETEQHCVPW